MLMNIYFACSITGGRSDETIYQTIVDVLVRHGHNVPTAHLSQSNVTALEDVVDPAEVYQRDTAWIKSSDGLIAEVSTPSHGVGYEISYALSLKKPVLCIFKEGVKVSKMILGNTNAGLTVKSYSAPEQAVNIIDSFLVGIKPEKKHYK